MHCSLPCFLLFFSGPCEGAALIREGAYLRGGGGLFESPGAYLRGGIYFLVNLYDNFLA